MTSSRVGTLAWAERTGGILSRRERIGLLGDAARLQMRILPAQTLALLGRTNPRGFSVDPDRYRDTVTGQACFAATAATVARDWSRERGWREPRCTALADAICQHLNPQVRPEHGTEAHLMQAGAGFDVVGMRHWEVATPTVKTVLARHPRLGFKKSFGSTMCAQADQHHGTRTHFLYRYMQFGARIKRAPYDD